MSKNEFTRRRFLIAGSAAAAGLGASNMLRIGDGTVQAATYDMIVEINLNPGDEGAERTADPDPRFDGSDPDPATFTTTQHAFEDLDKGKYGVHATSPGYYTETRVMYLYREGQLVAFTLQGV